MIFSASAISVTRIHARPPVAPKSEARPPVVRLTTGVSDGEDMNALAGAIIGIDHGLWKSLHPDTPRLTAKLPEQSRRSAGVGRCGFHRREETLREASVRPLRIKSAEQFCSHCASSSHVTAVMPSHCFGPPPAGALRPSLPHAVLVWPHLTLRAPCGGQFRPATRDSAAHRLHPRFRSGGTPSVTVAPAAGPRLNQEVSQKSSQSWLETCDQIGELSSPSTHAPEPNFQRPSLPPSVPQSPLPACPPTPLRPRFGGGSNSAIPTYLSATLVWTVVSLSAI